MIHSAQSWSARACSCGEVHAPCAPAVLAVLFGRPDPNIHLDPETCGIAVSPMHAPWNTPGWSEISCPTGDFNPWALDVVTHVVSGATQPGLVGFDLDDLVTTLRPARRLSFSRGRSPGNDLVAAAKSAMACAPGPFAPGCSLTVGFSSGPRTTLDEICAALTLLTDRVGDADVRFFAPLSEGEVAVSVLWA
jgi:hypothetical protein